jgi:4-hydroxybenzoate polyprenyltransferase
MFLLRFLTGVALAVRLVGGGRPGRAIAGALAWVLGIFAVYLFNGVTDVHEDRINGSGRPIARGALPTETAAQVAVGATALSLIMATVLDPMIGASVAALLALGYLYSSPPWSLKRRPLAVFVVGFLAGALTYFVGFISYAGAAVDDLDPAVPVFAVVMSLWLAVVGTLTKDLGDTVGDAAAGRRTVPVVRGERFALILAAVVALGLAGSLNALAAHWVPVLVVPGLAMLAGALVLTVVTHRRRAQSSRHQRRRPYRVFMATQFAIHLSLFSQLA